MYLKVLHNIIKQILQMWVEKNCEMFKGGIRSSRRNVIKDRVEITWIMRRGRFPRMNAANSPVSFPSLSTSSSIYVFAFIFMRLFWLLQTDVAHFILRSTRVSRIFFPQRCVPPVAPAIEGEAVASLSATAAKEYRDSRAHERSRM